MIKLMAATDFDSLLTQRYRSFANYGLSRWLPAVHHMLTSRFSNFALQGSGHRLTGSSGVGKPATRLATLGNQAGAGNPVVQLPMSSTGSLLA